MLALVPRRARVQMETSNHFLCGPTSDKSKCSQVFGGDLKKSILLQMKIENDLEFRERKDHFS